MAFCLVLVIGGGGGGGASMIKGFKLVSIVTDEPGHGEMATFESSLSFSSFSVGRCGGTFFGTSAISYR